MLAPLFLSFRAARPAARNPCERPKPMENSMSKPYVRLDKNDVAVLLVDHYIRW